mgnify:CR=1 FL=1
MNQYSYSDVTFIIPSRENLHFLKYAYDSIRRNIGSEPYILCADDYSVIDGSKLWMEETKNKDDRFDYIVNDGPERLGHVILYNSLVEKVKTKLFVLSHADMVWLQGSLDGLLKYMEPKMVISSTRCEPASLHPSEPCKISLNWLPTDPKDLDESKLQIYVNAIPPKYTYGIFAPYLMETNEYLEIDGCDSLFKPTSREDDDCWNRLLLNGCKFIQSWESFVYHRSCAGSRWNPTLTKVGINSTEWDDQQSKSTRNFIRKWGHFIEHDNWHHPILFHKYKIGFKVKNCTYQLLELLEPWCDNIWTDLSLGEIKSYILVEQPNTKFDLEDRLDYGMLSNQSFEPDVEVRIDCQRFNQQDFKYIQQLSEILTDSGEIGMMQLGNLIIDIQALNHYEHELIVCKNDK